MVPPEMTQYWFCSHTDSCVPSARNRAWSGVLCWLSSGKMMISSLTRINSHDIKVSYVVALQKYRVALLKSQKCALTVQSATEQLSAAVRDGHPTSVSNLDTVMQHMYFNVLLYIQTNEQAESSDSTPGNFSFTSEMLLPAIYIAH